MFIANYWLQNVFQNKMPMDESIYRHIDCFVRTKQYATQEEKRLLDEIILPHHNKYGRFISENLYQMYKDNVFIAKKLGFNHYDVYTQKNLYYMENVILRYDAELTLCMEERKYHEAIEFLQNTKKKASVDEITIKHYERCMKIYEKGKSLDELALSKKTYIEFKERIEEGKDNDNIEYMKKLIKDYEEKNNIK